jgi:hypothetical protein
MDSFSRTAAARTCSCISAAEKAGYTSLAEGLKIRYELLTTRAGKTAAAAAFVCPAV